MTIKNTKLNGASLPFWEAFKSKNLGQALQLFEQLDSQEKQSIFAELFQKSSYHQKPHSISVLFRELHEGKNFSDFHTAWVPAQAHAHTQKQAGQIFHEYFPVPIRVINAVNIQNPKEIVSVGLHWLSEEEAKHMMEIANDPKNNERGQAIAEVADKTKAGIYKVESDDNLGIPF